MKLVILDAATFGDADLTPLTRGFKSWSFHPATETGLISARLQEANVVVNNKAVLDREILTAAKRLQLICVAATGTDNVDVRAANALGIAVTNVPGYSTASVVSHTFAMYFHLAHHNRYYDDYTRAGRWCESPVFTHLGPAFRELEGKVWGIVGLGAIGSGVARAAAGFGCRVVYHSTSGANLKQPYPQLPLEELVQSADILSIHAPLNERTQGLFDGRLLRQMKPSAFLINTSRGELVNDRELVAVLKEGHPAGVALDVLAGEPPRREHPLLQQDFGSHLLLTPHIAWSSIEARQRLIEELRKNIRAFLEGRHRNRVNVS